MDDARGQVGGKYQLDHPIGGRESEAAWLAHDPQGRPVTLTFLDPRLANDPEIGRRLGAHRNLITGIRHENLVGVIDIVRGPSTLALVTEQVTGPTLGAYLRSHGTLSPEQVVQVGAAVAHGLAALHAHSLVHGDIRPDTVVLDTGANPQGAPLPRIGDVGLSLAPGERVDGLRMASGAAYHAPEYAVTGLPSPNSDLYALGSTLYELVCGAPPVAGSGPGIKPAAGRPAGVPDVLWNMIVWLLRPDPAARPAHAELVAQALAGSAPRTLSGPSTPPRAPSVYTPPPTPSIYTPQPASSHSSTAVPEPPRGSRTPTVVLITTLAVIALAGGGWWLTHRGSSATASDRTVPMVATSTSTPDSAPTVTATATMTVTRTATPTPTPRATTMSAAQALSALQAARTSSLAALGAPNDEWILQLSSKADGTTDKLQKTRSGSHTFHLPDIYEQYIDLQRQLTPQGVGVFMVESSDFGRQVSGPTYWTVIATEPSVVDQSSGTSACQKLFPRLSGNALLDTCMPRQYSAPH